MTETRKRACDVGECDVESVMSSVWCRVCDDIGCMTADMDPSFACSYNHVWWPFLSSWIVKLASFLLFADWAVKRNLLVGSITWEANWELFYFPLSLQFLVQFTVYRLSRSLRLATAISDVARACRSKKKKVYDSGYMMFGVVMSGIWSWMCGHDFWG